MIKRLLSNHINNFTTRKTEVMPIEITEPKITVKAVLIFLLNLAIDTVEYTTTNSSRCFKPLVLLYKRHRELIEMLGNKSNRKYQ